LARDVDAEETTSNGKPPDTPMMTEVHKNNKKKGKKNKNKKKRDVKQKQESMPYVIE